MHTPPTRKTALPCLAAALLAAGVSATAGLVVGGLVSLRAPHSGLAARCGGVNH